MPLININPDVKTIVNNATDINNPEPKKEVSMETNEISASPVPEQVPEQKPIPNKFFNFLEDEAANMQMMEPEVPKTPEPSNNIEVLEDISDLTLEPKNGEPELNTPIPSLVTPPIETVNNTIEEIKEEPKEKIVDPMDSVIKLDPNYEQIVEEAKGIDLKTAINEVRNMIANMEKQGFQMSLDEVDLADTYQITINIKKNN